MAIAASAAWNTPAASSQPIVEQSRRLRLISRRRSSSSRAGQLGFPRRGSPRAGQLECPVLVTCPLPLIIVASFRTRCSYRSNRKYSAQRELFFFYADGEPMFDHVTMKCEYILWTSEPTPSSCPGSSLPRDAST